jgi:hypothetical protein
MILRAVVLFLTLSRRPNCIHKENVAIAAAWYMRSIYGVRNGKHKTDEASN